MESEKGQQEGLLSGEVEKGATSSPVGSNTFKTALQVMSMLLLVVILCTLVAGIAFMAGARNTVSPEDGNIVDLGPSDVHDPNRIIRTATTGTTCNSSSDNCDIPAAHIVGGLPGFYDGSVPSAVTRRTHTVELFPLSQYSFAAGGIQVQRNKLVFNTSGFYHVYSQVTWATGRSVDLEAHNKPEKFTFGHTTMLFTRSYCRSQTKAFLRSIVPLMSSSYPVALNISRYPFTSTHAGSFWLCPGDRVYLQTRALAPCCIQRSETSTFLGAYLVRGPP